MIILLFSVKNIIFSHVTGTYPLAKHFLYATSFHLSLIAFVTLTMVLGDSSHGMLQQALTFLLPFCACSQQEFYIRIV